MTFVFGDPKPGVVEPHRVHDKLTFPYYSVVRKILKASLLLLVLIGLRNNSVITGHGEHFADRVRAVSFCAERGQVFKTSSTPINGDVSKPIDA